MSSRMTLSLLTTRLVVALPGSGAADAEEHVLQRRSGCRGSLLWACAGCAHLAAAPASSSRRRRTMMPASRPRRRRATVIAASPSVGTRVGKPRPSTTVSARLTSIVAVEVVDAGGEEQVLAAGERVVDRLRGVGRLGDEELARSGSTCRRSARRPRSRPTSSRCARGHEDVVAPVASRRRGTGFSGSPGSSRGSCTGRARAGREALRPARRRRRRTPGSRRRSSSRRRCCCG